MLVPAWPLLLPAFAAGPLPFPSAGAPAPGPGAHAAHEALALHDRAPRAPRAASALPPPGHGGPDRVVYGYLPYWTVGPEDVPWAHLTHLAVFNVNLESDGSLSSTSRWTSVAEQAVALGHAAGVKVHVCVTSFDDAVMDAVLGSPARRAATIAELGDLVDAYGADGVNVDFEGLPEARRQDLVTFVTELKARVPEVWLATPAVDWSDAWDYPALAAASDGLFIMGYAYHYTGGSAGPNAPLGAGDTWSRWSLDWTVADYLAAGTPPEKIVLGLPTYGQEWPVADSSVVPATTTDDGWSVTYAAAVADAAAYGRNYDGASDTPWYASSGTRQAWYDDDASLDVKMDWAVNAMGLGGVGFWAIGYDGNDPALWAAVDAASHVPEAPADDTGAPRDPEDTDSRGGRPPRAQVLSEEPAACACGGGGPPTTGWLLALPALGLARRRARGPAACA